jgi:hypothetical protein
LNSYLVVIEMSEARAIYDGRVFIPLTPIQVRKNQQVVITILDDTQKILADKPYIRYAGALPLNDYDEITEILKDTEAVFVDEW